MSSQIIADTSGVRIVADASGNLTFTVSGTLTYGKVIITQPATGSTLTILDGKTVTEKSTRTIQGTDGNVLDTDALIRSCYQGLLMTYVSTTSFSVGVGAVGDSTFVSTMVLAATTTKTTAAWAVGSAQGGLDTGAIAATTWYYVYLIKRVDTQVVDILYSTSATTPTMPTNYTLKRMIGAVKTNGSSQFIQWIMYNDGTQMWVTTLADVNDSTLTTARKSYTLTSIPPIQVKANLYVYANSATAAGTGVEFYGDTGISDSAPGTSPLNFVLNVPVVNQAAQSVIPMFFPSGILYARSNQASTTIIATARDFNLRPFN